MKNILYLVIILFIFLSCKKERQVELDSGRSTSVSGIEEITIDTNYISELYEFMVKLDSGSLDSVEFDTAMFCLEASLNAAMSIRDTTTCSVFQDSLTYSKTIFVGESGKRKINGNDIEDIFEDVLDKIETKLTNATMHGNMGTYGRYVKAIDVVWNNSTNTTQNILINYHWKSLYPLNWCTFTDDWYGWDQGGCFSNSGSAYKVTDFMDTYLNNESCNSDKACDGILTESQGGPKVLFPINVQTLRFYGSTEPDMYASYSNLDCLNATEIGNYTDGSNTVAQINAPIGLSSFSFNLWPDLAPWTSGPIYIHTLDVKYGKCVTMNIPFSRNGIIYD